MAGQPISGLPGELRLRFDGDVFDTGTAADTERLRPAPATQRYPLRSGAGPRKWATSWRARAQRRHHRLDGRNDLYPNGDSTISIIPATR
jgi:hypothetical protein